MVFRPGAARGGTLLLEYLAKPVAGPDELLVRLTACAVCRTDLDIVDGRLKSPLGNVIPGHQVVGEIVVDGSEENPTRLGERVGVAWIYSACGHCPRCTSGRENLCVRFRGTGCDANGGFAEYMVVPRAFAHPIPATLSDVTAAPLLCAGAIGWRSLRMANLTDGDPLGLTGFGTSAHIVLELARNRFPNSPIFVFARQPAEREFAQELGATWVGGAGSRPPLPCAAIIDTTPAWTPMLDALAHLAPGGRLVVNAIRKSPTDHSAVLGLDFVNHLWMEREIKTVANVTRADVREVLDAAVATGLRPTVTEFPLDAANEVLDGIRRGEPIRGARVLRIADSVDRLTAPQRTW